MANPRCAHCLGSGRATYQDGSRTYEATCICSLLRPPPPEPQAALFDDVTSIPPARIPRGKKR